MLRRVLRVCGGLLLEGEGGRVREREGSLRWKESFSWFAGGYLPVQHIRNTGKTTTTDSGRPGMENGGTLVVRLLALFHLFECCIVSFYFCQASRAIFCRVSSYILLLLSIT